MRSLTRALLSASLCCVLLAGCSLAGRKAQPPAKIPSGSNVPQPPPDVLNVPDAVPKYEPRGTRGNPPFYEVFGNR